VEATAAAWLSLRDRGMSPSETEEFIRWLQEDPRHAVVLAELDATWSDLNQLGVVPTAEAVSAADPDFLAPRPRPRHRRRAAWIALGAAAATTLLLVAALRPSRNTYETAVGAFQKLDLPDGSVAQLNTDSSLRLSFDGDERRVRVLRGEVFFTVAKDTRRPFVVTAGSVAVRAMGTAFNVRRHNDAVDVLVTEGRVRVDDVESGHSRLAPAHDSSEPPVLTAGERARVPVAEESAPATVAKVSPSETQRLLAWQERRLEFDAVPLGEVAREFNRYNRQQLIITDEALAMKRFSGVFRADGYESLLRLLESDFGVRIDRDERQIVLRLIVSRDSRASGALR
jgi:transmembrane sensor